MKTLVLIKIIIVTQGLCSIETVAKRIISGSDTQVL